MLGQFRLPYFIQLIMHLEPIFLLFPSLSLVDPSHDWGTKGCRLEKKKLHMFKITSYIITIRGHVKAQLCIVLCLILYEACEQYRIYPHFEEEGLEKKYQRSYTWNYKASEELSQVRTLAVRSSSWLRTFWVVVVVSWAVHHLFTEKWLTISYNGLLTVG